MRARLERWLLARWYGEPGILWLLWPVSLLYRAVVAWRRSRRTRARPPVPVLVVGNLTVGGSGKTPLVLWLVGALRAQGLRVGVISRGYGGAGPFPLDVTATTPAAACGDEPALLARRTGVPLVVDPDRRRALARLVARDIDVVVSDDGLQHYRLPRTVEIVVVDGRRGLGNGQLLPVGPLREPAARVAAADFVVVNGDGVIPAGAFAMRLAPVCLRSVGDPRQTLSLADFRARYGAAVTGVAGIGDPARFFDTLSALGFDVDAHPFPDHHVYVADDFVSFRDRALVMTEKDAAKCGAIAGPDAWYLEVEARLPDAFRERVLARLLKPEVLP